MLYIVVEAADNDPVGFIERNFSVILAAAVTIWTASLAYKQKKAEKASEVQAAKQASDDMKVRAAADTNDRIIDTLQEEVVRLRASSEARDRQDHLNYVELSRIRSLVFKLQEDMILFRAGVQILSDQILSLGHLPAWQPPEIPETRSNEQPHS